MSKRIYWKDVRKAITGSKGRFVSILLLMMLGSFALVGLKSTIPDMQTTASEYFTKYNTMDLTVMADYGLSKEDQEELSSLKNATVDYGYLSDVTLKNSSDSIRLFSYDDSYRISKYELVSGKLPNKSGEIALSNTYSKAYKIGDTITFEKGKGSPLKTDTYTITGFLNSSEILSKTSLGSSTAGDGSLTGYAVVLPQNFDSDVYSIARITYDDLAGLNPFKNSYKKKLAEHQKELNNLLADNGAVRLASLKADAQKEIDNAQEKVASAKTQLTAASNNYANTQSSMTDAQKQTYETQKADIEAQIAKAQEKISTAQSSIDSLTEPVYTSYTRSTLPGGKGYTTFSASTKSISAVANIFPVVLYLVAAMVTFTTMTRFVDEERQNSGILKGLGYSNSDIIRKFVIYGFLAGMLGTVVGVIAGTYYLPYSIGNISMSDLTLNKLKLSPFSQYIWLAFLLALVSSVLPAFWIAYKELREKPAQLLLPKPPVSGSKIFLERITFLWNRLSFTHKVTVRNIFRYKQRMLMTIFGVAGSVALLYAGLGIQSSISGVADSQFGNTLTYDMVVAENSKASADEKNDLAKEISSDDFSQSLGIYYETSQQSIQGVTESQTVTTLVAPKNDFSGLVNLTSINGDKLSLSSNGVIISEKLAELYGVKVGDSFIYVDDSGYRISLKVSGIAELYTGHFIFMTKDYYEKAYHTDFTSNAYLLKAKDNSDSHVKKLSAHLLALNGVTGVSQNIAMISTLKKVVHSLNGVMLILIIVSILMAIVILYNLTTINVAERIRELSTIKVLGFHNKEVTLYIYRETITLSIAGILAGLAGGYALHSFLISRMGGDDIIFEKSVNGYVYLIPILVITAILALLGWLVNRTLKKVDMLEALKSVD